MDRQLSFDQRALLVAAVDRLAPGDKNGPGAVELGVVDYIERSLASGDSDAASAWTIGLAAIDTRASGLHCCGFAALPGEDQDAVLLDFERDDDTGFFELLRDHLLQGMFGDPVWGGNRAGGGWDLLGYPGPKLVWTEAEQQLDA